MSIFGIAKKGFGMLKKNKSKTSPTITSVKPNKSDKLSKLSTKGLNIIGISRLFF